MEKMFIIIADNNIRSFVATLNEKKVTKEEIVKIIYKPASNDYMAIIYR